MTINKIINEDSRYILEHLPNEKIVTTTITSPPYFDMKDYGHEDQIGFGQSYNDYLKDLQNAFKQIHTITKDDGTLWIIIDTFKKDGQVIPLPFDLSAKLTESGWLLQDIIIWKKDKTVPWSANGFVQRKFEYILFFSKSKKFNYYKDRVRIYDTSHLKKWWVKYPERYNPKGKALDEVWEYPIPIQGSWGKKYIKHFCPLPTDMVGNMIQLTSNENEIIFDPFSGSGSVLSQASFMKRQYLGFELNSSYIEMFKNYLEKMNSKGQKKYELFTENKNQYEFEEIIINLRALKYAKVLLARIKKLIGKNDILIKVDILGESSIKHKIRKVQYSIIGETNREELNTLFDEIKIKPPLSKFGIEPHIEYFSNLVDISDTLLYAYTETNTHCTLGQIDIKKLSKKVKILSSIKVELNENDYD